MAIVLWRWQAKASEGEAYNVISNLPKNEDKMRVVEEKQMRTTLTRVKTEVEAYTSASAIAAEDKGACNVHCVDVLLC